jgi:hypothetical protein
MDVTILRIDLGDAEFNAPFAAGEGSEEDDDEESGATDTSGVGIDPRPVVAIAVLLGLALLARYLRSGEEDVEIEADELELEES